MSPRHEDLEPLRRLYRSVVPIAMRRGLRNAARRLRRPAPRTADVARTAPVRREFDLPLPVAGNEPTQDRRALRIEAPGNLYLAKVLEQAGFAGWEPATEALLLGLAELVRPEVVFDIGANIGPHALLLPAVLDTPVVAFEPASVPAATLRHLVSINDLRCVVEEVAVGDEDTTATLFLSPTDTSTSLVRGFRNAVGEVTVPVRSLDSYVGETGRAPALLKIDVETHEPAVLAGATRLLERRPWIVCEVLPDTTERALEDVLLPAGYRLFHVVDAQPLPEFPTIAGNASMEAMNWLFAPEPPTAQLWEMVSRWRRAIDACPPPARATA